MTRPFDAEFDLRARSEWDADKITTTPMVVGCELDLHRRRNQIIKVASPLDHPVTHSMLCVKGCFGYEFVQSDAPV